MGAPEGLHPCPTAEMLVAKKIVQEQSDDPWQHPYRIVCSGLDVSVASDGPDGNAGTDAHITSGPTPAPR